MRAVIHQAWLVYAFGKPVNLPSIFQFWLSPFPLLPRQHAITANMTLSAVETPIDEAKEGTPFRFLDLPPELRNIIYHFALCPSTPIEVRAQIASPFTPVTKRRPSTSRSLPYYRPPSKSVQKPRTFTTRQRPSNSPPAPSTAHCDGNETHAIKVSAQQRTKFPSSADFRLLLPPRLSSQ